MAKTACLCQPIIWRKAAILRDSTVVVVVAAAVAAVVAPTNSTASHDSHDKINSRVSFLVFYVDMGLRLAFGPLQLRYHTYLLLGTSP